MKSQALREISDFFHAFITISLYENFLLIDPGFPRYLDPDSPRDLGSVTWTSTPWFSSCLRFYGGQVTNALGLIRTSGLTDIVIARIPSLLQLPRRKRNS
jgi:hypothetical protein